jgi:hypothetical protein
MLSKNWALGPVFETTLQGTTFTEGTVNASKEKGEEKETLTTRSDKAQTKHRQSKDRSLSRGAPFEGRFCARRSVNSAAKSA